MMSMTPHKPTRSDHRIVTSSAPEKDQYLTKSNAKQPDAKIERKTRTLRRSRMNSNGIIQILLPSTHLHSNPETLHDLVAALSDDVDAYNPLFWPDADELVHGWLFVLFVDH
jgi:hypothetical protein